MKCRHKKVEHIEYTDNLPAITGDNSKYFSGVCAECGEEVFAQTGSKRIPWTTDRQDAYK